jgi:serine protease Do
VPVATLKTVLPQLREKGRVSRGYLGINIQNLDYDRAEAFGLEKAEGALVTRVIDDSPAAKAGIKHGDIVLTVDGRPVRETRDLIDYVSAQGPGKKVELGVLRDGKRLSRTVELTERDSGEEETGEAPEAEVGGLEWLGLDYQEITPATRESFGLPADVVGVVVRDVAASSPLYDEGVAPGDVIVEVNGTPVSGARSFEAAVSGVRPGGFVRLYLQRYDPRNNERSVSFFAIVRVP